MTENALIVSRRAALVIVSLLLGPVAPAMAQAARDQAGQSAQLQQQLQQLAGERTALQAENARLKRELEQLRSERDAARQREQSLEARARAGEASVLRSTRERESAAEELARANARQQELVARFRETAEALRETERDRGEVRRRLAALETDYAACVERNAKLYEIGTEVLQRLERRGFLEALGGSEPFTGIQRARLENLADDYRQRLEDERQPAPAP